MPFIQNAEVVVKLCAVALLLLCASSLIAAEETPEALQRKAKAVLTQTEGEITIAGLKEPVEVLRDRWGIPHIYAKNAHDLFLAQGFVVAQDRLFQLDQWRRVGNGETAELVGEKGIVADRIARLFKYRGDMQAEWSSYSPDTKEIATAFTDGINAYIDQVGDKLPVEFQILGCKPKKWKPEDCLARMSGIIMTRNWQTEILRAELINTVGLEKARRIMPTDPVRSFAPADTAALVGIRRSLLDDYTAATQPLPYKLGDESNNWVFDGTMSASGKPLLASDPHRPVTLPSLRYLVHLNAPGWNVIGSGEPGLPGVAIGHNEHVAWGFTIVGTDQADVFVEELNRDNPLEYRFGNDWDKMKVIREQINVRGRSNPYEIELHFTRHGPVIFEDTRLNLAYALKWVGHEPGGAAYLGSLALNRATSGKEFVRALEAWKTPSENMVYADVEGNIGWIATALTPVRKGWDGLLPVPGAKSAYEWQGFLPFKDLPQVHNPGSHYIVTANHNILPSGYKPEIAYEWAPIYRFARIEERIKEKKKFTLDDCRSMQHDNVSIPGRTLARLLPPLETKDKLVTKYAELLAKWDGDLSGDSRAGAIYGVWLQELLREFYRPHVPEKLREGVTGRAGVPVLLAALEKPDAFWFGDNPKAGRDRLLQTTFIAAVAKLKELLPGDDDKRTWGQLHVTPFRHPLSGLGSAYAKAFSLDSVPRSGDSSTPNAASHNAKFEQTGGASYRHIFDLADWDKGIATSTPGQSGQPGSPHYADLLPLWAKGEYFPLAFSKRKVEEVTQQRLILKPKGKS